MDDLHALIHSPRKDYAGALLESLGLAGIPDKEHIHKELEEDLLLPKERLQHHWLSKYQVFWTEDTDIPWLLPVAPARAPTRIEFVRAGLEGRVTGYTEVRAPKPSTGLTSTSLDRLPSSARTFVRGKSGNTPFLPGGLDGVLGEFGNNSHRKFLTGVDGTDGRLLSIAPGLRRGLRLPGMDIEEEESLAELDAIGREYVDNAVNDDAFIAASPATAGPSKLRYSPIQADIDELLPISRTYFLPDSTTTSHSIRVRHTAQHQRQKKDWAHVIDITQPFPEYEALKASGGLAREYPFELDAFQKAAVAHLERGESVFVAAHTSAGKTVVAEYAVALAVRHVTRTIYTSPIKALSNQKFRDFKMTFGGPNVGILTGDVQINPDAPCVIMTTEILRSMLYKGADLLRDVEWVVFDEVHYVSDAERGVVWEEVIIMLPEHVGVILLSATIPNTKEFADWVGRTKRKDVYVISTPKRPVPLEHFLYAGRDTFKVINDKGEFLTQGYKDAGEALRRKQDKERQAAGLPPVQRLGAAARGGPPSLQRGGRGGLSQRGGRGAPPRGGGVSQRTTHHTQDKSLFVHLLGHLKKKDLLPAVVFTFSKKRCEEQAATLLNMDLCTSVEKSEVHVAVGRALARLSPADRKVPQIGRMRELLSRGIGVHHGGLLPIVKEVVEILFSRGLVKILFATETFAMGVNMPARCVVFSGMRKHDGRSFRDILPGEYTQMSGRAGRRGLDATGVVIVIIGDELPETAVLHKMMLGTPSRLQSQFRLTYNMILNLLRVEALRVEEMIKRSFSENASQRLLPDQQKKVIESEKRLGAMARLSCDICEPSIEGYYDTSADIIELNQRILGMASEYQQGMKLLSSGRVIVLKDEHFPSNIGVLLKIAPFQSSTGGVLDHQKVYFVLALVTSETKSREQDVDPQTITPQWPPKPESLLVDRGVYELRVVPLSSISLVTNHSLRVNVTSIVEQHKITPMREVIGQLDILVREWLREGVPGIPEVDWGRIRLLEFQEMLRKRNTLATSLSSYRCLACSDFDTHYHIFHGEKVLRANIAILKLAISDQNLELLPDYEQRISVLKDLKFIDDNSTVLLKGRVACEINSAHELILTELILENTLAGYEPEEVVALLSCFVFQEKTEVTPVIPPKLQAGQEAIHSIMERVDKVQLQHNVGEDLGSRIKFGLVEVVYEWAKGMPFEQIATLTDVPEGTIVRVITRLDETCREIRDAARVIGDAELFRKMEEAQVKIKRDIVFAASLYF